MAETATHIGGETLVAVDRISVITRGLDFREITRDVTRWLENRQAETGLMTAFIQHSSASLVVQENSDPTIVNNLLGALDDMVPVSDEMRATPRAADDMISHVRAYMGGTNVAVPVCGGRLMLGLRQGLFVAEHRERPMQRNVMLHFQGVVGRSNGRGLPRTAPVSYNSAA